MRSNKYEPKTLSKEIYDLVFKSIKNKLIEKKKLEEVLPEGATIMWSLDGNLRYLPMAALYDGEKYLIELRNLAIMANYKAYMMTELSNFAHRQSHLFQLCMIPAPGFPTEYQPTQKSFQLPGEIKR